MVNQVWTEPDPNLKVDGIYDVVWKVITAVSTALLQVSYALTELHPHTLEVAQTP